MTDIDYLALTLIGEARGEPIEGQVAVANVIHNRAFSSGKSFKEICLAPLQFSCWNSKDPNRKLLDSLIVKLENEEPISDPYIRQCFAIAKAVALGDFMDNTKGAKNYVTIDRYQLAKARQGKSDQWMLKLKPSATIYNHIFLV
jgi:N-acetylmuramoyl-L-alanine amidase